MAEIKIRVGAAADASLRTVFKPLVQSAMEARRAIMAELGNIPRELGQRYAQGSRTAATALRGIEASARLTGKAVSDSSRAAAGDMAKEFSRAARAAEAEMRREHAAIDKGARASARAQVAAARQAEREKLMAARATAREQMALDRETARHAAYWARTKVALVRQAHQDELREQQRGAHQAAMLARLQGRELDRFASRTSHRATRFFWPNMPVASMARRAGSEVLRGLGVDPTISGAIQRGVQLETSSVSAVQQARLAGDKTTSSDEVQARVRQVSNDRRLGRDQTIGAVEAFQKKTGDLKMGLELLDAFALRAGATSTDLADFADAAGDVALNLGDIPNKAQAVLRVMDAVTVQGARGAVEVRDLATHMARLASVAPKFAGSTSDNMIKMGALAQLARATGGAPSAAEAARSVVGFGNTLKKGARIKAFDKAGVDVFADEGKTQFKDPIQLIKESLTSTGGNLQEMNKLFMDVVGARAVAGLAKAYNAAGGGEKGLAAVDKELNTYLKDASLPQDLLDRSNADRMGTKAAKVQGFQNKLDDIADEASKRLLPALERLAPKAIELAEGFGRLVGWSAENPGKAIVAAIVFSIGRAGLESAFRTAIERAIMGAAGKGPLGYPQLPGATTVPQLPGGKGGAPGAPGAPIPKGGVAAVGLAGILGAIGLGAMIGLPLAGYIDYEGKTGFDTNKDKLNALSSYTSTLSGPELKAQLPHIEKAFATLKDQRSWLDGAMGWSDTEFDSFEKYLAKRKKDAEKPEEPKDSQGRKLVRYEGEPGESAESLRKRVLANPNDPTLKRISEEALPDFPKLGTVAGAFKWDKKGGPKLGDDPVTQAMIRAGILPGGSGSSGGQQAQQAAASQTAQTLTRLDENQKQTNRLLQQLLTQPLTVKNVTPNFNGVDPNGTVGT
jgi:hypothetical protein